MIGVIKNGTLDIFHYFLVFFFLFLEPEHARFLPFDTGPIYKVKPDQKNLKIFSRYGSVLGRKANLTLYRVTHKPGTGDNKWFFVKDKVIKVDIQTIDLRNKIREVVMTFPGESHKWAYHHYMLVLNEIPSFDIYNFTIVGKCFNPK